MTIDQVGIAAGGRLARWRLIFRRLTEPAQTGLPRWRTLLWFPGLLLLFMIIMIALGISGSSTGVFWAMFGSGPDPNLLAGDPQWIRGDEWATQGSWIVSQASQGFPKINDAFPGGMDAAGFFDLPTWDWTTLLRPQTAGFLVLGLDRGLAWRWWLPAVAATAACYCMFITLVPRRPLTCAVVAVAVFFSPLAQWIFLPMVFWPTALCFFAIGATVFSLRDGRRWVRIVWAVLTGWIALCAALTLYPPFIIAGLLATVPLCLGSFLFEAARSRLGPRNALGRLVPLLVAAGCAVVVLGIYAIAHADSLKSIASTVYPGERLQPTGAADFLGMIGIFSGPFSDGLQFAQPFPGYSGALGHDASTASTPLLMGLFLTIPLAWFVVRDWHRNREIQWMLIACLFSMSVIFAFLFIPGWDALAHVLFLDRMTVVRTRLGLGMVSVIAIALLVRRLDDGAARLPWAVSVVTAGVAAASIVAVWATLRSLADPALANSRHHLLISVLMIAGIVLYTRGRPLVASIGFLVISLILTAGVNPLYRGMFDLRTTSAGEAVSRINEARPGTWLGIGNFYLTFVLVESGVTGLNGVQPNPSSEMWQQIDPGGSAENVWNRYASLVWEPGVGNPQLRTPQDDLIVATFDSCSDFAREHVTYVMADKPVDQVCLRQLDQVTQGATTAWFYEVVS